MSYLIEKNCILWDIDPDVTTPKKLMYLRECSYKSIFYLLIFSHCSSKYPNEAPPQSILPNRSNNSLADKRWINKNNKWWIFLGKNIDGYHVANLHPINFHRYYTPFGSMSALIDRLLRCYMAAQSRKKIDRKICWHNCQLIILVWCEQTKKYHWKSDNQLQNPLFSQWDFFDFRKHEKWTRNK